MTNTTATATEVRRARSIPHPAIYTDPRTPARGRKAPPGIHGTPKHVGSRSGSEDETPQRRSLSLPEPERNGWLEASDRLPGITARILSNLETLAHQWADGVQRCRLRFGGKCRTLRRLAVALDGADVLRTRGQLNATAARALRARTARQEGQRPP